MGLINIATKKNPPQNKEVIPAINSVLTELPLSFT